jgi:hypothetical protein
MVASSVVPLTKNSQAAFIEYYRSLQAMLNTSRGEKRARYEKEDRAYQREVDRSEEDQRAKAANAAGDTTKFQNMTVPVVMPQVEAAVTHQVSVYLTGDPIFGVVAPPRFIDEALQLQSILEDNAIRGSWPQELILHFRDGFKYNFAPVEVSWKSEVTYSVETNLDENIKEGQPKEVIWSGNTLTRWDPYNTFIDERVDPSKLYKDGEFAGRTEFMTRIKLKSFIAELPDKIIANIVPAFESGLGGTTGAVDAGAMNFYVPLINPKVSAEDLKGGTNWLKWAGISTDKRLSAIDYKDSYEVTTLYCKILPAEFSLNVPNGNTPQIYKLIIVNHQHIIYAELQTNAHGYLPVMIGQPLEDGLAYQTKSLADNGIPFQELTTTYMNSIIASRRRAISDRLLYDPSRITSAHINSANPSAKIPVRPAAYGKNLAESVFPFPYREDQSSNSMQQIQVLLAMSNDLAGQNKAQQGQFTKGNRTLEEFDTIMQNANGRDQLASILLEYQVFMPMKQILKVNTLQFQGGTTIYNRDKDVEVEIDPIALRKAVMDFRVSDGLLPSEKILNTSAFATGVQAIATSPQIAAAYNLAPAFSYLMKTQGASELTAFEKSPEQIAFEQAAQQWQQLALTAIDKGIDPSKLPPQPLPAQFGYDPAANKPTPEGTTQIPGANPPTTPQAGDQ